MSGLLSAATNALGLGNLFSGGSTVRAGSFRGVPFEVETASGEGGRRVVTHEFPLRDQPETEDLGRAAQKHRLRCFVIGDDYQSKRDALLKACQDNATVGTLVHPWLGEKQCRAGILHWIESKDRGGYAAFDIEFVEAGQKASVAGFWDTAGSLLHGLLTILPVIKRVYAVMSLAEKRPGYLSAFGTSLFSGFVERALGLPPSTINGLRTALGGLPPSSHLDAVTSDGVVAVFQGAAVNVINAAAVPVRPVDTISASTAVPPRRGDLTGGLLGLTAWGHTLVAVVPSTPILAARAAQQAAIVGLIEGAATVAVLQVYAAIDWPSADAAAAALGQVVSLIDARTDAAADAGQDDLYHAWQAIGAMAVEDVARRAAQAPRLARYGLAGDLPSLALAHLLHQDAGRAEELEALNDAIHPAFMPRSGLRLVP